jgi:hypothetical protein
VTFLVRQELLEKLHRDIVACLVTDVARFLVSGARIVFARKIGESKYGQLNADSANEAE